MRADNRAAEMVKRELAAIGYTELSYFRQDEAQEILDLLRPAHTAEEPESAAASVPQSDAAETAQDMPDDLVDCPLRPGDRMSISQYCKTTCPDRNQSGFCPALGEDPPVAEGAMI